MRLLIITTFCVTTLWGQGGGGVQFRDWTAPAPTAKPAVACGELRTLTSFDLYVIGAPVTPASATAPEHCRVSLMVPPEINMEVNLPTAWNGRLYMFGNGGWAGESFTSAGRRGKRGAGDKNRLRGGGHGHGALGSARTRRKFCGEPAEASRLRIPVSPRHG